MGHRMIIDTLYIIITAQVLLHMYTSIRMTNRLNLTRNRKSYKNQTNTKENSERQLVLIFEISLVSHLMLIIEIKFCLQPTHQTSKQTSRHHSEKISNSALQKQVQLKGHHEDITCH